MQESRPPAGPRPGLGLVIMLLLAGMLPQAASAQQLIGLVAAGEAAIGRLAPLVELRLEDGGTAVLAGITVPEGAAAAATAMLDRLLANALIAAESEATADRYGRRPMLAAAPGGQSLQDALLESGLALVQPLPGADPALVERLLVAEARAARAGTGLWQRPEAMVVTSEPDAALARQGQFTLVEGRVLQAVAQQRYFYLNFGTDWRTDMTARIDRETLRTMQRAGFEPSELEGRRVRVRGTLFAANGPMIELWTHHGIEILE